jgi:tetratricopeptide (TPR) repeat protein
MSRSGGDRRGGDDSRRLLGARLSPLAALLLAGSLAAGPAAAAPEQPAAGFELTGQVEETLTQLPEQWLQWISSSYRDSPESASKAVSNLLTITRQLGLTRVRDLSLAAGAHAVEAARDGDAQRAAWTLEAAERLDPGRPETAFAAAAVARIEGRWARSVLDTARGWAFRLRQPDERRLLAHGAAGFALWVLLGSGALFVALLMATRGGPLLHDLAALAGRVLPSPLAYAAALGALLWPLVLPWGLAWLALYWSALLWSHSSLSQRAVLLALWLLAAVTPALLAEQRLRVAVELSPPARALDNVVEGRLYGGLYTDLGVLRSRLPDHPAVLQLLADLHRRMGDWDVARTLYHQVRDLEPENADVLIDLGAYYFYRRDYGNAIDSFRRASLVAPENTAAYFNLSQAFSESYSFEESHRALDEAKRIDSRRVDRWIANGTRIQAIDGGIARAPEIRRALLEARRMALTEVSAPTLMPDARTLWALAALVGLALAVGAVRRAVLGAAGAAADGPEPGQWGRALVPGLASAQAGAGPAAVAALVPAVALAMLPLASQIAYRPPVGVDPATPLAWIAVAGLAALLGVRWWRVSRGSG